MLHSKDIQFTQRRIRKELNKELKNMLKIIRIREKFMFEFINKIYN